MDPRSGSDGGGHRGQSASVYRDIRVIGMALYLPIMMIAGPIGGYYIGGWIGAWAGSAFWGHTIGLVLGVVTAVYQVIAIIRRLSREMH